MPLFENCKTRTVKSKSGAYNEDPIIVSSKGKGKEIKYTKEVGCGGKGKIVKTDTQESASFTKNKKYIIEKISKSNDIWENKWML